MTVLQFIPFIVAGFISTSTISTIAAILLLCLFVIFSGNAAFPVSFFGFFTWYIFQSDKLGIGSGVWTFTRVICVTLIILLFLILPLWLRLCAICRKTSGSYKAQLLIEFLFACQLVTLIGGGLALKVIYSIVVVGFIILQWFRVLKKSKSN